MKSKTFYENEKSTAAQGGCFRAGGVQGTKAGTLPSMCKHDHPTHLGLLGSLDKARESKAGERNKVPWVVAN